MVIDLFEPDCFVRRLCGLYNMWRAETSLLYRVDCFMCVVGNNPDNVCSKSNALQIWLFGKEMINTLCIFCPKDVYIMTHNENTLIPQLKFLNYQNANMPNIHLISAGEPGRDQENFETLKNAMKSSKNGMIVGVLSKKQSHGEFCKSWFESLKTENFKQLDIHSGIALLMAVKNKTEVEIMTKASLLSVNSFKILRDRIMYIIDLNMKVKHSKIVNMLRREKSSLLLEDKADVDCMDFSYDPIIQSGDSDIFNYTNEKNDNYLHYGVIVCSVGIRYKYYCANITRTLMVNPSEEVKSKYNILLDIHGKVLQLLRPNVKLCDIYNEVIGYVESEYPDLIQYLTKSFGFGIGLKAKESSLTISKNCTAVSRANMSFNVFVGFSLLKDRTENQIEDKVYQLFVADTVIVKELHPAKILTTSKNLINNVGIFFEESNEEQKKEDPKELLRQSAASAILNKRLRDDQNSEDKLRTHQDQLGDEVNKKAMERLVEGANLKDTFNSYCLERDYKFPKVTEIKQLKIFVDTKYETVVLPVFGVPVPFHLSTIKNISLSDGSGYTNLRINFYHPGSTINKKDWRINTKSPYMYVKELTFRSSNTKTFYNDRLPYSLKTVFDLIKRVQKDFKTRENEVRESTNLVQQGTIKLTQLNFPKLRELHIRPNVTTKRLIGRLEAHYNGFRYRAAGGRSDICIDILYDNIKSAFFQPSDGELIILLHLRLKHAIMIGNKRSFDVQFYREIGEVSTDLGRNLQTREKEEDTSEENERQQRKSLQIVFQNFIDQIEDKRLEFEKPLKTFKFLGTPFRSTVTFQTTSKNLVNLTEWPPFILQLDEVEVVHLERVSMMLKTFDMSFIFKDYNAKVVSISNVPSSSRDQILKWLDSQDILVTRTNCNLYWPKIMKLIREDPESFFSSGGWKKLDMDKTEDDDEESPDDDEDENYEPSNSNSSNDDGSDLSEASETSNTNAEGKLESDEESGKDWSDLEDEAAYEDEQIDSGLVPQKSNSSVYPSRKTRAHSKPSTHHPMKRSRK